MVTEKKFKFEFNNERKHFIARVWGFFTIDDANGFLQTYQEIVKTFNTNDYILVIDGTDLKTFSADVAAVLQKVMKLYMQIPFKKRYSIELKSVLTSMQLQRLVQDIVKDFIFVKSESEIE